jgi:hypothetical protein
MGELWEEKIKITQEAIENNASMATEIMKNIEIIGIIGIIEIIGIIGITERIEIIEGDKEETTIEDIITLLSTQIAKMKNKMNGKITGRKGELK